MSEELLYTSAPSGLKIGSRDYCTVARTQSMPTALADELEGLSGYRIIYMPRDPNASKNPVVWSHLRIPFQGRLVSVLSRISASGLDYTGRTNKFAHHVALDDHERPVGGPAWLLSQPRFMIPAWDGQVRMIPVGRPAPRGDSPLGVANAWKAATGDPGWAGVIAESYLDDPKRLVYVVYRPGMDLLPLFAEAEALLPPEKRWEVAFNTYYTNLPTGVSCPWLGIIADSPEITEARRMTRSLLIDLTQPIGSARGGPLVDQARTGIRTASRPKPPVSRPTPPSEPPSIDPMGRAARGSSASLDHRSSRERTPEIHFPAAAPPPIDRSASAAHTPPPLRKSRQKASLMPLILASSGAGVLLITTGVVVGVWLMKPAPVPVVTENTDVSSSATASGGPSEVASKETPGSNEGVVLLRIIVHAIKNRDLVYDQAKKASRPFRDRWFSGEPRRDTPPKPEAWEPKTSYVRLPYIKGDGEKSMILFDDLPKGKDVSLSLVGLKEAAATGPRILIENAKGSEKSGSIKIIYDARTGLGSSPSSVAEFSVKDRTIQFEWDKNIKANAVEYAQQIRDCYLEVQLDGKLWRKIYLRKTRREPKSISIGQKRSILWEAEEAPRQPIQIFKTEVVARPGVSGPALTPRPPLPAGAPLPEGAPLPQEPLAATPTPTVLIVPGEIAADGTSASFRFRSKSREPLVMTLSMKSEVERNLGFLTEFSPSLFDLKKDAKENQLKLTKVRGEINRTGAILENGVKGTSENILPARLARLKDEEARLVVDEEDIREKLDLIEKLKASHELKVEIGFKLGSEEFIAATLGVDGADPK